LQRHRNYPLASEFINRTVATGEKRLEFERQLLVRYSVHLRGCIIVIIITAIIITTVIIIIIINDGITGLRDTECHSRVASSYSGSLSVETGEGVWLS
jgi:hypothetical protein